MSSREFKARYKRKKMNNRNPISSRAALFKPSVIDEVARLCSEYHAINLALGAPELPTPNEIKEAAIEAISGGQNQYTNSWGARPLREAIVAKTAECLRVEVDPETEVTVTCGTTESMLNVMMVINEPGNEVIVFEPFFDNYIPVIRISGATVRYVRLRRPDWSFDEREVRNAFNSRTRAIIINTPSNPTGKVFTVEELSFIADLCQRWNVFCITDEVYEHMVFDGLEHHSMLQIEGMAERTIVMSGLSKTYSLTGWRIGYIIAPAEITRAVRNVHSFTTYCAPAPLQAAGVTALRMPAGYYQSFSSDIQKRRDYLMNALEQCGFACYKPSGAFYLMADISRFRFTNDVDFVRFLIKDMGVAAVPGSGFYATKPDDGGDLVRFCFGKSYETIAEAEKRLIKIAGWQLVAT